MKRLISIYFLVFIAVLSAKAQNDDKRNLFKQIEAAKIAYVTKELSLSPSDAERFFPLYNQYQRELHNLIQQRRSKTGKKRGELEFDSEVLALKMRYRDAFIPIINAQRTARFFEAEREFREKLIKELRERRDH
ncbi:hypothetical protein GCM10023231_26300 [Olivibacter ginsenosidimutans]|uniref:Sensor of ECF-type sigma factor n=1 Tax=Olivibacter ginsenosidimutans TaxID=1176537 RepID=A0ABP9BMZ6_9SPHI